MKLSLALPVYNGENFLRQALESAMLQGPELEEIVVADNCSTDGTPEIVRACAARDPRVRLVRSERFLEQADNVSRAILECRGAWVQLLCHDDLLLPGSMQALSTLLDSEGTAAASFLAHQPAHLFVNGQVHRTCRGVSEVSDLEAWQAVAVPAASPCRVHPPGRELSEKLRKGSMPYLPSLTTAAVNRRVFQESGGFDPRWTHFDVFLWLRLMQSHSHAVVDAHWSLTRVHPAQVAVAARRTQKSYRDFRDFFGSFIPEAASRYSLSLPVQLVLRLKPYSQAAAPVVVALHRRSWGSILPCMKPLPLMAWPLVTAFAALNYFREWRRNAALWRKVPPHLSYE